MDNRYIIDQAEFVLSETVNKFDMGNKEMGMDEIEMNHLYTALKKEELVRDNVSKADALRTMFRASRQEGVGLPGMLERHDIKLLVKMLDEDGILVLE